MTQQAGLLIIIEYIKKRLKFIALAYFFVIINGKSIYRYLFLNFENQHHFILDSNHLLVAKPLQREGRIFLSQYNTKAFEMNNSISHNFFSRFSLKNSGIICLYSK
jgi:hypothetical protein